MAPANFEPCPVCGKPVIAYVGRRPDDMVIAHRSCVAAKSMVSGFAGLRNRLVPESVAPTASFVTPEVEELLRIAIGTAFVQSGFFDQDPEWGEIDVLEYHPCDTENCYPSCACSGVPYLSEEIWKQINKFGEFAEAIAILKGEWYERQPTPGDRGGDFRDPPDPGCGCD